jgi:hypothetical protein
MARNKSKNSRKDSNCETTTWSETDVLLIDESIPGFTIDVWPGHAGKQFLVVVNATHPDAECDYGEDLTNSNDWKRVAHRIIGEMMRGA